MHTYAHECTLMRMKRCVNCGQPGLNRWLRPKIRRWRIVTKFVRHTVEQSYTRLVTVYCTSLKMTGYMHSKQTQIAEFYFVRCFTQIAWKSSGVYISEEQSIKWHNICMICQLQWIEWDLCVAHQGWRTCSPQNNFVWPAKHSSENSSYYFRLLFVSVDEQCFSFLTGFIVWPKSSVSRLLSGNWQSGPR